MICFLTGSSGCGKTYLGSALGQRLDAARALVLHFDEIGIPPTDEMIRDFGSGEKWQEATTHKWIEKIASIQDKPLVILEGQYHPQFALDACRKLRLSEFTIAVVTCESSVWAQRLCGPRGQPHLVNEDMRNWDKILHQKTVELGGSVIDTTDSDLLKNLSDVAKLINPLLTKRLGKQGDTAT